MKFAIKCSYVEITGIGCLSVAKDPITDQGKRNKLGRLKLIKSIDGIYQTFSSSQDLEKYEAAEDHLETVFENGKLLKEYSLETIREKCDINPDLVDSMPVLKILDSSS
jgi:nicotinamide phosphoribosyltransferase